MTALIKIKIQIIFEQKPYRSTEKCNMLVKPLLQIVASLYFIPFYPTDIRMYIDEKG